MKPSHITISEVARIMGKSQQWVARLVKRGDLPSVASGGITLVCRKSAENYKPKLPGRPKS